MAAANNNTIEITNFIPKGNPGRAGLAVKRLVKRIFWNVDGTERCINSDHVITNTATTRVITALESGTKFIHNALTSTDYTLPAPAAGLEFTFFAQLATTSGVGINIKTNGSSEKVYGKVSASGATLAEAAGKGIVNTQATAVKGDNVHLYSDGTNWFAEVSGIWAVGA